jgi:hypothetical protein
MIAAFSPFPPFFFIYDVKKWKYTAQVWAVISEANKVKSLKERIAQLASVKQISS